MNLTQFLENETVQVVMMCLATLRILLSVMGLAWDKMPLAQKYPAALKVHETGLYLSIGVLVLLAPSFLL